MGIEAKGNISRREFLKIAFVGAFLRPELRVSAQTQINFNELVKQSGDYEPDRVYPILSSIPLFPTEYNLPAGNVMTVTEKELVSAFRQMVTTVDTDLFTNSDGTHSSSYYVSHQPNIDPKLYGGKLHLGVDMVTNDSHNNDTIFLNPVRGRLVGRVDIPRLSLGTPISQLIDEKDNNIVATLGGVECSVFMLYGHLIQLKNSQKVGEIIEIHDPLGDITRNERVGGSSGPHCHAEMVLIPISKLNAQKTIQRILLDKEYGGVNNNITIDDTFIWKFLPGDLKAKTGIAPAVFEITKSIENKRRHYGEKTK